MGVPRNAVDMPPAHAMEPSSGLMAQLYTGYDLPNAFVFAGTSNIPSDTWMSFHNLMFPSLDHVIQSLSPLVNMAP